MLTKPARFLSFCFLLSTNSKAGASLLGILAGTQGGRWGGRGGGGRGGVGRGGEGRGRAGAGVQPPPPRPQARAHLVVAGRQVPFGRGRRLGGGRGGAGARGGAWGRGRLPLPVGPWVNGGCGRGLGRGLRHGCRLRKFCQENPSARVQTGPATPRLPPCFSSPHPRVCSAFSKLTSSLSPSKTEAWRAVCPHLLFGLQGFPVWGDPLTPPSCLHPAGCRVLPLYPLESLLTLPSLSTLLGLGQLRCAPADFIARMSQLGRPRR